MFPLGRRAESQEMVYAPDLLHFREQLAAKVPDAGPSAQVGVSACPPLAPEQTSELLGRARSGDSAALDALLGRCMAPLRRWARGRLPAYARELLDTDDLVQESLVSALRNLDDFQPRHQGALQAYLRQSVLNRIRDEIRRAGRHNPPEALGESHPDRGASPLELAIGQQALERYESALRRLREADREAIVGRVELQYSYAELAVALGKPSPDAARVAVTRALARLVEEMSHGA
jgi:RNA polymerase sigma-70 factor (ECF subfamily)